jgi:meiotic recombination protein REC8, fungi type
MQYQSLEVNPGSAVQLTFDDIVPKTTSTRHIAAAGFYHCLGMW